MEAEQHSIAIIGGATAGAEAADIFARQGILTVVFEQNARPYGKIEDGLPKWHVGLRAKEYQTIDRKLDQEHVHYVPGTTIGIDVELRELIEEWGFQSVMLRSPGLPSGSRLRGAALAKAGPQAHLDVMGIEGLPALRADDLGVHHLLAGPVEVLDGLPAPVVVPAIPQRTRAIITG